MKYKEFESMLLSCGPLIGDETPKFCHVTPHEEEASSDYIHRKLV